MASHHVQRVRHVTDTSMSIVDDDDDGLAYGSDKRKAGSMEDDGVDTADVGAGLLRG